VAAVAPSAEPTPEPVAVAPPTPKPEPEPEPEPVAAPVAAATPPPAPKPAEAPKPEEPPKPISGHGRWSGQQVFARGCTRCHAGIAAPRLRPADYSVRQWKRIFRKSSRHDRFARLARFFSPRELAAARGYVLGQLEAKAESRRSKGNVAGVQ